MRYLFSSAFPLLRKEGDLRSDRGMSQVPSIEELRSIDPTIPGGSLLSERRRIASTPYSVTETKPE